MNAGSLAEGRNLEADLLGLLLRRADQISAFHLRIIAQSRPRFKRNYA